LIHIFLKKIFHRKKFILNIRLFIHVVIFFTVKHDNIPVSIRTLQVSQNTKMFWTPWQFINFNYLINCFRYILKSHVYKKEKSIFQAWHFAYTHNSIICIQQKLSMEIMCLILINSSKKKIFGVPRVVNELCLSESGLIQTQLMKIRVELTRVRETLRTEKSNSSSPRYYSS
jgi:hypothetical protein